MTKKYQWVIAALTVTLFFGLISNTIFPNKVPSLKVSSTKGEAMMIYDKNYKFTIINFWATDCPGCVKEMP
ncbi:TlpA family protein disulfide reductase, partial [archaeon]|nr:TlpA family protein disulfide reductase [archaeon]